VEIEEQYYVDGGLAEYLPAESLHEFGCNFIIGSNLAPVVQSYRRPHHILQLVIQITGLMARKNLVRSEKFVDLMIHPDLDRFSSFDFDNADKMIEVGYDTTRRMIDELYKAWEQKGSLRSRLLRRLRRAD
jgi:NTE family protein